MHSQQSRLEVKYQSDVIVAQNDMVLSVIKQNSFAQSIIWNWALRLLMGSRCITRLFVRGWNNRLRFKRTILLADKIGLLFYEYLRLMVKVSTSSEECIKDDAIDQTTSEVFGM